jgi:hypothetical protein
MIDDDLIIEFNPSAFRHVSEEDIRWALETAQYDGEVIPEEENSEDKNLLIGFDRNARAIEVFYNIIDEQTVSIFHAMKCSKKYLPLIRQER